MLLFIDFEKAFDTLEWKFLQKTLRFYNFGDSIITWIKLLYSDIIAAAYKINGGPENSSSLIEALGKDACFPFISLF